MAKTLQRILLFFSLVLICNILKNVKIVYSPVARGLLSETTEGLTTFWYADAPPARMVDSHRRRGVCVPRVAIVQKKPSFMGTAFCFCN